MKHKANLKIAAPVAAILVAFAISLIIWPAVNAAPKELPVALVSLDQGITLPTGDVNMGAQVVQGISEKMAAAMADQDPAPMKLITLDTQEDLDQGFSNRDFFAAIVIPADFTAKKLVGQDVSLTLILDQGQSLAVANALEQNIASLGETAGMTFETEYLNPVGSDMAGGNANLFAFIITWITTFVASILLSLAFRNAEPKNVRPVLMQILIAAVTAVLLSLSVTFILANEFGFGIPFGVTFGFLSIAVFCLMMMVIGLMNWLGALGAVLVALMMLFGLVASNLPYEMLPVFWQDFVHPWIPLRFLGDGIKEIFYLAGGVWNGATPVLLGIGIGGAALVLVSPWRPRRKKEEAVSE